LKKRSSFASLLLSLPFLLLKISFTLLAFKRKRRSGVRAFRRQLELAGLKENHIKELVRNYEEMGALRNLIKGGLPFKT